MKTAPALASCFAVLMVVSLPAIAEAANYKDICRSTRLSATERKECRTFMKNADTETEQAGIFRYYDLKIAGFEADPALLPAESPVRAAKDSK